MHQYESLGVSDSKKVWCTDISFQIHKICVKRIACLHLFYRKNYFEVCEPFPRCQPSVRRRRLYAALHCIVVGPPSWPWSVGRKKNYVLGFLDFLCFEGRPHCALLFAQFRYMSNIYLFNIFGCCLEVFGTGVKSRQPRVFCYQKFIFVTLNQSAFYICLTQYNWI